LGAIIFELHRQERREPELLQAKAAELEAVDYEVRALTDALGAGYGLPRLTARGLVAGCTACGGIMGVRDRHCPSCGAAAGAPAELGDGERNDDEDEDEPRALDEPSYDEDIAVRVAEQASVATTGDGETNGDVPHWFSESNGRASEAPAAKPWPARPEHRAHPQSEDEPALPADAAPSEPEREPLVPRAQRTMRAGRRLALNWLEERRPGGR
jgi:hypothetical protein